MNFSDVTGMAKEEEAMSGKVNFSQVINHKIGSLQRISVVGGDELGVGSWGGGSPLTLTNELFRRHE